jgi:hypothetical protein
MIYVDELKKCRPVDEGGGRWRWNNSCHLFTDNIADDLHGFAQKIGLKREYFQAVPGFPHFDLTKTMRSRAVREGATQVTSRQMAKMFHAGQIA